MKFSEYKTGMVFESGPREVTEEEMLAFANQYDPQWFHTDKERAVKSRWGGLIASGWHTCAMVMKMAVDAALKDSESFASPGLDSLKWLKPVRAGDKLYWTGTVKAKRHSNSRPGIGIILWTWEVTNQNDEMVLELEVTSLFDIMDQFNQAD